MTGKLSVLLADDHTLFRQGLARLIGEEEDMFVVAEADNGQAAVALAKQHHPDIAILDISMPLLDGIEAGSRIKSVSPTTRVLLLSAYESGDYVKRAVRAGITGYLLKQVDMSMLSSSIRLLHRGELVIDSAPSAQLLKLLMDSPVPAPEGHSTETLQPRELEVLRLVARGRSNKEVASELGISERTVQSHMLNIFRKLGVGSRTAAVLHALRQKWVKLDELP